MLLPFTITGHGAGPQLDSVSLSLLQEMWTPKFKASLPWQIERLDIYPVVSVADVGKGVLYDLDTNLGADMFHDQVCCSVKQCGSQDAFLPHA